MNDFEQLPNNWESESSWHWSVTQETLDSLNIWSVLWENWGRSLTQTMKDEWKKQETINRRKPEAVRKLPETVNFLSDTCPIIAFPCPSLDFSSRLLKTWMMCHLLLKISDWFAWVLCAFSNVCRLWQRQRRYAIKQYDAGLLPTFDCFWLLDSCLSAFDCLTLPALFPFSVSAIMSNWTWTLLNITNHRC